MTSVAFYPSIAELEANPYWPQLAAALRRRGFEVDPNASLPFTAGALWTRRRSPRVLHFHYIQQFYSYEWSYARLRWVIRFARNLVLARAFGHRTVFTVHNLRPTYELKPAWVDYLGHWFAVNLTHAVIVHCQLARTALRRRFGRSRGVHVIEHPNFMDVYPATIEPEEARTRLGLDLHNTVFAFVGGIRPNKGVHSLIEAFRAVPADNLRLVIAGKAWPPEEYITGLATAAAADPRIKLEPGFIPDDELQVYLRAADAVVLPFESIMTSGSAILAMGMGRPVIAPARGCLPELIGRDAGVLYDPAAPEGLEQAIRACQVLDLRKMGDAARERVKTYTWDRMAERTMRAYGG